MSASKSSEEVPQNVMYVTPQQLAILKQSLHEEIEQLSELLKQLRAANNKFVDSKLALADIGPESNGKKIMLPITTSLYVPANLSENKTVLVDIGSSIYVRKSVSGAKDYFTRQISFIHNQVTQMEKLIQNKVMDLHRLEQIQIPTPEEIKEKQSS